MKRNRLIFYLMVVLCIGFLLSCSENRDSDREKENHDETVEYPKVDKSLRLNGSYTIGEYLELSKKSALLFYWVCEDHPSKDSEIECIYVFADGQVYVFNDMDILQEAWGKEMTLGDMLRCDDNQIIEKLWTTYETQVDHVINMIVHDELMEVDSGMMFSGDEPEWLVPISIPVASDYYGIIYTDETGNEVKNEILLLPAPWGNNVVRSRTDSRFFWSIDRRDGEVRGKLYRGTGMGDEANELATPIALSQMIQGEIYESAYVGFASERVEIPRGTTRGGCFITRQQNDIQLIIDELDESFAKVDPSYEDVEVMITELWYQTDNSLRYFERLCDKGVDVEQIPTPTDVPLPTNTPVITTVPGQNEDSVEPADDRDLGGLNVVIADWWTPENYNEPSNRYEEDYWTFQEDMMKAHNYTIERKKVSEWATMTESVMLSITTNRPVGQVIVLDSGFVAALLDKGLFADVANIKEFDFKEEKWNQEVIEVMTVGDAIYGFASGLEPRTGVFFNMDLFEQLGVDPELPYDLQAAEKWTWEEFEKLCAQLTQDTNNDGQMDVYGITSFSNDLFQACLQSNDTNVIVKGDAGELVMNTSDPAVLEALDWGRGLYDKGYHMPLPEDKNVTWDWFIRAFEEQKTAMRVCEEYNVSTINQYGFEFGFVCFPKGPSADSMLSIIRENICIIPKCNATKELVDDIAYAYDKFTDCAPGYENDDTAWKDGYESLFADERAVNETLDLMINELDANMSCTILLSAYDWDWVVDIGDGVATPAQQLEAFGSQWQTMVNEFNAKIN